MFKIIGDEVHLDGWLVARLNANLPATLLQMVEDTLAGGKYRNEIEDLESKIAEMENEIESLEAECASYRERIEELESDVEALEHDLKEAG